MRLSINCLINVNVGVARGLIMSQLALMCGKVCALTEDCEQVIFNFDPFGFFCPAAGVADENLSNHVKNPQNSLFSHIYLL